MKKNVCDVDTRKSFRIVANILVVSIILSAIGIAIGTMVIVDTFTIHDTFPFSKVIDPPYLITIFGVLLILFVVMGISLHKIREKTCRSMDLPLI